MRQSLGYVTRNDWNREYYGFEPGSYLEDESTGKKLHKHLSVNALKQNTSILKYVEVKVVK